jgi:hypothetical protein
MLTFLVHLIPAVRRRKLMEVRRQIESAREGLKLARSRHGRCRHFVREIARLMVEERRWA